jgi:hypothetical protein
MVAPAVINGGSADSIGSGRLGGVLPRSSAWPDLGKSNAVEENRTLSDCTAAPRNGIFSGCHTLHPDYKSLTQRDQLLEIKLTGLPRKSELPGKAERR